MSSVREFLYSLFMLLLTFSSSGSISINENNIIKSVDGYVPKYAAPLDRGSSQFSANTIGSGPFGDRIVDLPKAGVDITVGVVQKIPDALPSVDSLMSMSKNALIGYPFEYVFKAINTLCRAALSTDALKPKIKPNMTAMNFILKVGDEDISVPLTQPARLWSHAKFNRDLPVVVFVTGWNTNYNVSKNEALDVMYEAYRCRGGVNFVSLDSANFIDTLYTWSAFDTDVVGDLLGQALQLLIETYPIENIHLIGHSLGCHICGSAGRYVYHHTERLLPRITGLDPANPCFNEGERLGGLQRGDASFVDVIHSNNGALGKREQTGDADYYPNGLHPLPPGCLDIVCAHFFAFRVYAESVYPENENSFMAVRCTSQYALESNLCPGRRVAMGYAAQNTTKGNFFLKTNSKSPYGLHNLVGSKFTCNE